METGAQPPQMLADGEVLMTTAYNGRIFNAQVSENQPFVIVWDGQVLDFGQLAVPAGTPRLAEAMQFLQFASGLPRWPVSGGTSLTVRRESRPRLSSRRTLKPVRR